MIQLVKIVILLSVYRVNSFRLHGFGTGYRYLNQQLTPVFGFEKEEVETKWIKQPIDHFDANNTQIWSMRYFRNLEFWKPNGTIYLFIGGEGEAYPGFLTTGTMYELAKETKGAMFGSEHRYYGQSIPFKNLDAESLKFLSSRQALADLEHLLKFIKRNRKFRYSKIVVFGGSYPGNLAAWMKLLYPDMIDAAVASSAPVLAKKDFAEYIDQVAVDYEQLAPPKCWDKIGQIFSRYDKMFKTKQGIKHLKEEENICENVDMSLPENRQLFFLDKISQFMVLAQYGSPQHIMRHCNKLQNSSRISSSKEIIEDEPGFWRQETECFDYEFYNMIEEMREVDWITSWIYQTCTEFGYFQTTTSDFHPFTKNVPVELYYKMCSGMFGPDFNEEVVDEGVKRTNELYGGINPNMTHVVFVNGDMDPWHRLSVIEDLSYEAPAKVIPRVSHCTDLFSNRRGDSEELKEARSYVKYLIKSWLGLGDYFKE